MHKSSWALAAASIAVALSSCTEERRSPPPPPVLSERMGLTVGTGQLALGGDCTAFEGSTGCANGGVCLRQTPGFPSRGVCSQRCVNLVVTPSSDGGTREWVKTECPTVNGVKWVCVTVMPTPDGMLCVPPSSAFDAGPRAATLASDGGEL